MFSAQRVDVKSLHSPSISWRAGHKGFPDTKWATTKSFVRRRFAVYGIFNSSTTKSFVRRRFAVYGIFNSSTTLLTNWKCRRRQNVFEQNFLLSLTSCLGNPCVPPFTISQCEWAQKSLSPSWNSSSSSNHKAGTLTPRKTVNLRASLVTNNNARRVVQWKTMTAIWYELK